LDATSITNTAVKALVSFDATTDIITIASGTDDTSHKAAIGYHTIKFLAVSQTDVTLTAKEYLVTLTYDHTDCATFIWHFTASSSAAYTDATEDKLNVDALSLPHAFTLPAIVTSTGSPTDCKYYWQNSLTVDASTFTLATSFTTVFDATTKQASFTGYTADSNPWGRHKIVQVAKDL